MPYSLVSSRIRAIALFIPLRSRLFFPEAHYFSSIGLFAADILGMLIGYLLKSKAPEGILNTVAFFIFSIFGILTLRQGFGLLLGAESAMILPLTVVVTVAFVIVCLVLYKQAKKN